MLFDLTNKVYLTTCNAVCTPGSYADVSDRKCKSCSAACETCFGPNSNQCNSCTGVYYFTAFTTTCSISCDVGYFNGAANTC